MVAGVRENKAVDRMSPLDREQPAHLIQGGKRPMRMMLPMPIHSAIKARLVIGHLLSARSPILPGRRTTAFTCRAGCKQRDVSKNRVAGPVKCRILMKVWLLSLSPGGFVMQYLSQTAASYVGVDLHARTPAPVRPRRRRWRKAVPQCCRPRPFLDAIALPARPRRRLRVHALRVRCVRWGPDRGAARRLEGTPIPPV